MSVQTTYSKDHAPNYRGQVVDANDVAIMSAVAETTITPGDALIEGAASGSVRLPNATGVFRGVAVRSLDIQANSSGVIEYISGNEVACLRRGRIAVEVNETVVAGDPVFFIHSGGDEGKFRNDVDTANATQIVGAEFLTGNTAGNLVVINIPSAVA